MIDPQQQIVLPPPAQEAYPTATAYSVQPQPQPQPQVRRETPGDVAAKYNVDIGDLMRANPTLRGPYEPIPAGAQIVLPPARKRESARDVARRHNVEVRQLIAANPSIRSEDDMIDPQQQIVLPPPAQEAYPTATAYSVQPQPQPQPQVRRETPGDVAAKYNVDIGDLMRANPTLRGPYEPIPAGAQIVLPPARKRESARDVARRHNIEVRQLIAANPSIRSEDDMIDPQQQIVLPPPAQEAYPTATAYSVQPQPQPQPQVRRETPGDVAAKYNVEIGDLMRANPTLRGPYEPIPAGAQIVLPPARKRESARDVARRHNVEVRQLIAANPSIRSEDDMIDPQQQIVLPLAAQEAYPTATAYSVSRQSAMDASGYSASNAVSDVVAYRAPQSARVADFCAKFGISEVSLFELNPSLQVRGEVAEDGFVLLPSTLAPAADALREMRYRPSAAESVSAIAHRHGVSVDSLLSANAGIGSVVEPDVEVVIPDSYDEPAQGPSVTTSRTGFAYYVTAGVDTLESVAHRLGCALEDVVRENPALQNVPPREILSNRKVECVFVPASYAMRASGSSSRCGVHVCTDGETIASVAHKYGIAPETLLFNNPTAKELHSPLPPRKSLVIPEREEPPSYVRMRKGESVSELAQRLDVDEEAVLAANPILRRNTASYDGDVLVPSSARRSTAIPPERLKRCTVHTAAPGDTLQNVAFRYFVPEESIVSWNPTLASALRSGRIPPGRKIFVFEPNDASSAELANIPLTVKVDSHEGDTLASISRRYFVPIAELRAANPSIRDESQALPKGSKVTVRRSVSDENKKVWDTMQYVCPVNAQRGDTLRTVMTKYRVTESALRLANPELPVSMDTELQVGARLYIPTQDPRLNDAQWGATMYTIRHGETLSAIAQKYCVDEQNLRELNRGSNFMPLDTIVVPFSQSNPFIRVTQLSGNQPLRVFAESYGITEDELIRANPQLTPARGGVAPPQHVIIPAAAQTERKKARRVRFVEALPGDTIETISCRLHVSPKEVQRTAAADAAPTLQYGERVIVPDDAPRRHKKREQFERLSYHVALENDTAESVAAKYNTTKEMIRLLNPNLTKRISSGQRVLVPLQKTAPQSVPSSRVHSPTAPFNPEEDKFALTSNVRAATEIDRWRQTQQSYEEFKDVLSTVVSDLQSRNDVGTDKMRGQLRALLQMNTQLSRDVEEVLRASSAWEARCKSAEQVITMGDAAQLRQETCKLLGQIENMRKDAYETEKGLTTKLQREYDAKLKTVERSKNEEIERLKAAVEFRTAIVPSHDGVTSQSAEVASPRQQQQQHLEETASPSPLTNRTAHNVVKGAPEMPQALVAFMQYKNETVSRLCAQNSDLEVQNKAVLAQNAELTEQIGNVSFLLDSRPTLLQLLYTAFRSELQCIRDLESLMSRASARDLGRMVLLQELGGLEDQLKALAKNDKWIIGNLFTEAELLHLGASPAYFAAPAGSEPLAIGDSPVALPVAPKALTERGRSPMRQVVPQLNRPSSPARPPSQRRQPTPQRHSTPPRQATPSSTGHPSVRPQNGRSYSPIRRL